MDKALELTPQVAHHEMSKHDLSNLKRRLEPLEWVAEAGQVRALVMAMLTHAGSEEPRYAVEGTTA